MKKIKTLLLLLMVTTTLCAQQSSISTNDYLTKAKNQNSIGLVLLTTGTIMLIFGTIGITTLDWEDDGYSFAAYLFFFRPNCRYH